MENKSNWSSKASSFLASQTVSLFSEELIRFALPAVYFLKTNDPFGSSLLYCCVLAPRIFLGPFLAYLSDRFLPQLIFKRVILGQAILMAILPLAISLFTATNLWVWSIATFALSTLNSIQYAAIQTILPQFWKREKLLHANGLLTSFESTALFLAPLGAGFLLDIVGFGYLCYAAALVNLGAFFLQNGIAMEHPLQVKNALPDKRIFSRAWSFIGKNKPLLFNVLLTSPINMLLAICLALLAPLVLQESNNKAHLLGIIMSMGTAGQFLGGFACRYLGSHLSIKWIFYGGFIIGGGFGLLTMGFFSSFLGLGIGFFFCGFGIALIHATNQTFWQLACPDSIRSRVIAARRSINSCLGPIGFLIAVPLATFFTSFVNYPASISSYSLTFTVCGVLFLLLGCLGGFLKICDTQSVSLEEKRCLSED